MADDALDRANGLPVLWVGGKSFTSDDLRDGLGDVDLSDIDSFSRTRERVEAPASGAAAAEWLRKRKSEVERERARAEG